MPLRPSRRAGRLFAATLLLLAPAPVVLHAQQPAVPVAPPTGRLIGRIVDAETGAGLPDVGVQVVGTTLGALSGIDGRYALGRVPAGTVTIAIRRIGYAPRTLTGLVLSPDSTLQQDVALAPVTVRLQAQVVTATAARGTTREALDRQRTAAGIVSAVTAEQIAKSPDGDAAQAVQRVSGVTVQDGKYVFVRGLGERYTTASLNGARIPSPEPDRKVVPLDLFPAGLIQSITTSKTFTPDQPGDFSGASVDIQTREFPVRRQIAYSATVGANATALRGGLPGAPGVGGERLALAGGGRDLQRALRLAGDLRDAAYTTEFTNPLIRGFRDAWRAERAGAAPNSSYSASVGGSDALLGHRVGYLLSGSYAYAQEVAAGQRRALAATGSDGRPIEIDRFEGTTGRAAAAWGTLLNLGTMVGAKSRIAFSGTYNRTADDEARVERGAFSSLGIPAEITRLRYVERGVGSAQLAVTHQLGERHTLDWAVTGSRVTRAEPDRSEFATELATDPVTGAERRLWIASGEGAVRSYGDLTERAAESRVNYRLAFGGADQHALRLGVLGRRATRDADNRSYGIQAGSIDDATRALDPATLFGPRFTEGDTRQLELVSLAQGGSYTASDQVLAGYLMSELASGERLRVVGGARVEESKVRVEARSTLGDRSVAQPRYLDVLPALALTVKLADAQNLRLSATRTLARPEYRELADVISRSVMQGEFVRGSPGLRRTTIDNADLRWEWYRAPGEVLSAGVFAKRFDDPIERVYQATSSNAVIEYVNADAAVDYGAELEARTGLGFLGAPFAPLSAFTNLTVMRSEIRLGRSAAASTNPNRAMLGQAPYVVNAGLTWAADGARWSATALYNRVGERIVAAGERPLPDVIERPRDVLDLSLRFPVAGQVAGRIDARNLFDAGFEQSQGSVVREAYRAGRVFQFGLTWHR